MLKTTSKLTPFDLLKALEPFAAKCYQNSFKQENNLQSRFKAATSHLYSKTAFDGSRVDILNTQTMMEIINVSVKELKDDPMFHRMGPEDALELLYQLIQESRQKTKIEQEMLYELEERTQEKKWSSLFVNLSGEWALKAFFANPKAGLILKGSKLITSRKLAAFFTEAPNAGTKIRFLSLPESPLLTYKDLRILVEECPNIEYLNISGSPKLKEIITAKGEWPLLIRFEARGCLALEKFVSYSPIKVLRIGTTSQIEIFVENPSLDIFAISTETNIFELIFRRGKDFEVKLRDKTISNADLLGVTPEKEEIAKYLRDWKITIATKEFVFKTAWHKVLKSILELNSHFNSTRGAGGKAPLSDISWIRPLLLDASQSEISRALSSPWTSLTHLDGGQNIDDEGAKAPEKSQSLPNLIELDVNCHNIGDEGTNAFTFNILRNHLRDLSLSLNKIRDGGKQAFEENLKFSIASEFDFNKNDIGNTGRTESAKRTSQTSTFHGILDGNKTSEEPTRRDQPQFNSFEHTELDREGADESIRKVGSITEEDNSSGFNCLIGFLNTPEKYMH